jgi:hypothetical protein
MVFVLFISTDVRGDSGFHLLGHINKELPLFIPNFEDSSRINECIRGRPRLTLAPQPSMTYCASPSVSTPQQSYTSDEV